MAECYPAKLLGCLNLMGLICYGDKVYFINFVEFGYCSNIMAYLRNVCLYSGLYKKYNTRYFVCIVVNELLFVYFNCN